MSRPRKPIGPNPPGRLLGTMIKVLAAEMSDQGRLSRGKRYWSDDAIVDIVVGHGAVTAEVQGSRPEPYVVTVEASGGEGVPGKREVWAQCTCPDDTGTGVDLCKHAVAALFALADEITVEPQLLERWRSGRRFTSAPVTSAHLAEVTELPLASRAPLDDTRAPHDSGDSADRVSGRRAEPGHDDASPGGAEVIELHRHVDHERDVISRLLAAPAGAVPPSFPAVAELDHGAIRDRRLAAVLEDCLDHLAIRWE